MHNNGQVRHFIKDEVYYALKNGIELKDEDELDNESYVNSCHQTIEDIDFLQNGQHNFKNMRI